MNPMDYIARLLLMQQGMSPELINQQLKILRAKSPTQGNLFSSFGDKVKPTNPLTLNPGPVRPPAPGQLPLFPTPQARGPLTISKYETPATNKFMEKPKPTSRVGTKGVPKPQPLKTFGKQLVSPANLTQAVLTNLALSNFGQAGENPEARARRLGYASEAEQRLAIAMYQQGVPPEQIKASLSRGPLKDQDNPALVKALTEPGGLFYLGSIAPSEAPTSPSKAPKPARGGGGTTGATEAPSRRPQPVGGSTRKPMEKAYGESGKDLYMSHKNNNPLMIRYFGENYGSKQKQETK